MQNESVIEATLRQVRHILINNPSSNGIADAEVLSRLRGYIARPSVQDAMQRANDTLILFALRAVNHLLVDQSTSPRLMVNRVREVMDDSELTRILAGNKVSPFEQLKKPRTR
jgi:hypothetical protein